MSIVKTGELPAEALLDRYRKEGGYTDCYYVDFPRTVAQEVCIEAFYTTTLFKLERLILSFVMRKPSSDEQAKSLAEGELDRFAVWRVEDRVENQLLLREASGRTRSWLMTVPIDHSNPLSGTRLYFGSAVVPRRDPATGQESIGPLFKLFMGFHIAYSRMLLRAAYSRIVRTGVYYEP